MRIVLRKLESLGGLAVAADETLERDRITLGRGTDQDVELPDMRVTLAHAEIRQQAGGWRLECQGENPAWVNGSPVLSAQIRPGDTIDLGRFRIGVGRPEGDADLLLEVHERVTAREEKGRRRGAFSTTLAQAGLRKRSWAWGLAGAVLVLGLIAPPVLRYGLHGGRSLDASWQSGPPSAAHSAFVQQCDRCHVTPFVGVRNDACLACHKQQAHHSDDAQVLALPGMGHERCASCHAEHRGRDALIARSTALCTACHARPERHYAIAHLPPVRRFDADHPAFTLSLPALQDGRPVRAEVAQGAGAVLRDASNLTFPHDQHLNPEGVNAPDGPRVLACGDCHVPAGRGFAPIRFAEQCAQCHRLDFDPDRPGSRLLHGRPDEVVAQIREHYAGAALAGGVREPSAPEVVRLIRRPGEALTPPQAQAALAWADAQAGRTVEDVFSRRICAECHVVSRTGEAAHPWRIAPVMLTDTYFTGARFDHSAHASERCGRCHAARKAHLATDVMIPDIGNCRECHGDPGASGRVATACVDCHGFHIAQKTVFGPAGAMAKAAPPAPAAARPRLRLDTGIEGAAAAKPPAPPAGPATP